MSYFSGENAVGEGDDTNRKGRAFFPTVKFPINRVKMRGEIAGFSSEIPPCLGGHFFRVTQAYDSRRTFTFQDYRKCRTLKTYQFAGP